MYTFDVKILDALNVTVGAHEIERCIHSVFGTSLEIGRSASGSPASAQPGLNLAKSRSHRKAK